MNFKYIFFIIILISLTSCSSQIIIPKPTEHIVIKVEVAQTPEEHIKGLMYKKELKQNTGMFFIFEKERALQFWMKNMNFPIDIIYLDKDFKIIDIKNNFRPCTSDPCPIYIPTEPAKYVLEVNAGFAEKHNIKIKDNIIFKK